MSTVVVLVDVVVVVVLVVVTGVALVLFKHLTDRLPNHSEANSSITHNPLSLGAKSVLHTGEISTDNYTQAVRTLSNIEMLTEWHRFTEVLIHDEDQGTEMCHGSF